MEKCFICGKEFEGLDYIARYHLKTHKVKSKDYYNKYYKKSGDGNCLKCNNQTNFNGIIKGYNLFCSTCQPKSKDDFIICYGEELGLDLYFKKCCKISNKLTKNKISVNEYKKYSSVKCSNCGKEKRIPLSRLNKKNNHFCNKKCYNKWKSKKMKKEECIFITRKDLVIKSSIERYGCYPSCKSDIVKERIKKTTIERYGCYPAIKRQDIKDKSLQTKIKNNTLHNNGFYSKSSFDFFTELVSNLTDDLDCYYGKRELFLINDKKYYFYDFEAKNNKKIIEFNGDYWHANPKKYNDDDILKYYGGKSKVAKNIWKDDEIKNNIAKNNGYDVLIIWESDVNNNRELVMKKCVNFINNIKD